MKRFHLLHTRMHDSVEKPSSIPKILLRMAS